MSSSTRPPPPPPWPGATIGAPLFERLLAAVLHGHWHTTTFIAGLRQTGIIAPLVLDGPTTGPAFRAYIKHFLAPALGTGDVVVLDNLAAYKVDGVRQAIAAAGASILYLPALQPGSQPDRAAVRQTQGAPPQGRGADQRRALAGHRPLPRRRPAKLSAPTTSTTAAMVPSNVKML